MGIQNLLKQLDARLRGNDEASVKCSFYDAILVGYLQNAEILAVYAIRIAD